MGQDNPWIFFSQIGMVIFRTGPPGLWHSLTQTASEKSSRCTMEYDSHLGGFSYWISWLLVSTPLKNISQLGWWFPIYGKIKLMFQSTNQISHGIPSHAACFACCTLQPAATPSSANACSWLHSLRHGVKSVGSVRSVWVNRKNLQWSIHWQIHWWFADELPINSNY